MFLQAPEGVFGALDRECWGRIEDVCIIKVQVTLPGMSGACTSESIP